MTSSPSGLRIALTVDPEIPVPPLHYGGIERIVDMLARGLSARGHVVTLFASAASTCPVDRVGWPGARSNSRGDSLRNMAILTAAVLRGGVDLVHSFSRLAYLGPILPLPVPKLMSYQREISGRTTSLAHRLSRGTLEFSAISKQMIEREPLVGTWHMVPNGVDLSTYDFVADCGTDAPLVFLGRIEEIKGPHLAIDIARRAGVRLVIAGNIPAEHRSWFDAVIRPHIDGHAVEYVGPVDDKAKNILLGRARALLMPILWEEPFGIVMAEAMACGTPVLGLARGAVPEVVEHGVTGYVADSVDGLVLAVPELGRIRRTNCRARIETQYSAGAIVDAYLGVYSGMLAHRPAALQRLHERADA